MSKTQLEVTISMDDEKAKEQELPPAMACTLALAKAIHEAFPGKDNHAFAVLVFKAAMHAEFFREPSPLPSRKFLN